MRQNEKTKKKNTKKQIEKNPIAQRLLSNYKKKKKTNKHTRKSKMFANKKNSRTDIGIPKQNQEQFK